MKKNEYGKGDKYKSGNKEGNCGGRVAAMTNTEKAVSLRVFRCQEGTVSTLTSAVKNTNYWFR